jgi:predicted alpha/beta-hydrolase family hydrolase
MNEQRAKFSVGKAGEVSGLLMAPIKPKACLILAHGAGAGMMHSFMERIAVELGEQGIASFRYQFPYMEQGNRRPDPPPVAEAAVRAAVTETTRLLPKIPLVAGGKSFGGRMTSQAQARDPLPGVLGLVFLGFPLHPAGKPSTTRAEHLSGVKVPMLFLQGAKDKLAEIELLEPLVSKLRSSELQIIPDADHSFHVPKRSGKSDDDVISELAVAISTWALRTLPLS